MSNVIKILVVGNYSNYVSARPEAEIFISLAQNSIYNIEIITEENCIYARKFKEAGIKVVNHTPTKKISKKSIELIRDRLKKENHKILLLFNSKAIINGIIAAKKLPVKIVLYRGCAGNISWLDPSMYFKYLHPRVDYIVCNAMAAQELFEKQVGFQKGKAITIHKGHDQSWYNDVEAIDLKTLNIPDKSFVVTTVANARPIKGIQYVLEAFNYIPPEYPIYLLLIGKGHNTKENFRHITNNINKSKIQLLGFRKDSLSIVKSSDVFVLASLGQETLTKSVIEAMCLDTTPIITNISGNKELVQHEISGLIVPVKNAKAIAESIIKIYKNPTLAEELKNNAKIRIHKVLSHQKTVEQYSDFFKSLIN